jgi:AGCS family alanine or glycine:cation symporter
VWLSLFLLVGQGPFFWMWVIAFLSMETGFAESVLGQLYKVSDDNKNFVAGQPTILSKAWVNIGWLFYSPVVCFSVTA